MEITLNPHGPDHVCAASTDKMLHRSAWIDREGTVFVSTNSLEVGDSFDPIPDYDGLTEFAREADAALRAAVAGR